MRSRLTALARCLDALDPHEALCAVCAGPAPVVEIVVVAGEPEPEVPEPAACLDPAHCPGRAVDQLVIAHCRPAGTEEET